MPILVTAFVLLLLSAPGVLAQTDVDFSCATIVSCNGNVGLSAGNYSSGGITVYDLTGPYLSTVPFTLAFNTLTKTISITDGTDTLVGTILSVFAVSVGQNTGLTFSVTWPTLPAAVQNQLGTLTGTDSVTLQFKTSTGVVNDGSVVISPTPEPTSMLLMGSGLLALGAVLRRKKRAAAASV